MNLNCLKCGRLMPAGRILKYCKECKQEYYQKNKENWKKYESSKKTKLGVNSASYYRVSCRVRLMMKLGMKCSKCEFNDFRLLELDHINEDGRIDRSSGARMRWIKENLNGLRADAQLLCPNCHALKTWNARKMELPNYGLIEKVYAELKCQSDPPQ